MALADARDRPRALASRASPGPMRQHMSSTAGADGSNSGAAGPPATGRAGSPSAMSGTGAASWARLDWILSDDVLESDAIPECARAHRRRARPSDSGDVWLTAEPGCEFEVSGGDAHAGGGSHGALHALDSLSPVIIGGAGARAAAAHAFGRYRPAVHGTAGSVDEISRRSGQGRMTLRGDSTRTC